MHLRSHLSQSTSTNNVSPKFCACASKSNFRAAHNSFFAVPVCSASAAVAEPIRYDTLRYNTRQSSSDSRVYWTLPCKQEPATPTQSQRLHRSTQLEQPQSIPHIHAARRRRKHVALRRLQILCLAPFCLHRHLDFLDCSISSILLSLPCLTRCRVALHFGEPDNTLALSATSSHIH